MREPPFHVRHQAHAAFASVPWCFVELKSRSIVDLRHHISRLVSAHDYDSMLFKKTRSKPETAELKPEASRVTS